MVQFLTLFIQVCFACKCVFRDWHTYFLEALHVFLKKGTLDRYSLEMYCIVINSRGNWKEGQLPQKCLPLRYEDVFLCVFH